jgi:hypothetical protein
LVVTDRAIDWPLTIQVIATIAAAISAIAAAVAAVASLVSIRKQQAGARRANLEALHEALSELERLLNGPFVPRGEFEMWQHAVDRHLKKFPKGIPAVDVVVSSKPGSALTSTQGWVLNPGQVEELKPLMTNAIVQVGILLENG